MDACVRKNCVPGLVIHVFSSLFWLSVRFSLSGPVIKHCQDSQLHHATGINTSHSKAPITMPFLNYLPSLVVSGCETLATFARSVA